jgi:glycerol-3-phosphate acyltransferase PlsY
MDDVTLQTLLWTVIGFISGSLMLAYWFGRAAARVDARAHGDGNPGAANVIAAGGAKIGLIALFLDVFKGLIPVALAKYAVGLNGIPLVIAALAPVFGHAYSPFLRGRGGKAVAVSFGVWTALTIWEAPTFGGLLLGFWFSIVVRSGWAVMLTLLCLIAYYLLARPDPVMLAVLAVNAALLVWKYRADLRHAPGFRSWILRRLQR